MTRTGQTGRTARRVVPFEGTGVEGDAVKRRARSRSGGMRIRARGCARIRGAGALARMTDEGKKNVGDDRRWRRGLRRRGVAGGIWVWAGGAEHVARGRRVRSGSVAHLSSSAFLRLDALPGPGPRAPPLYGALSASPRRRCWNFIRFLHLSLSCTPVRPLRRFGVGCEGERGNQRGFKARAGREEARGAPKRARAADAPRDQPPTISTLILRAPSRAVRTRDSWVARSSHRTIFARVGVGAGETRDARASVRARGTHLSTLKSGSCRIFSHAPMPCFCTASRSACSSSSSQYPRNGICGAAFLSFALGVLDFIATAPPSRPAVASSVQVRCSPVSRWSSLGRQTSPSCARFAARARIGQTRETAPAKDTTTPAQN